MKVVIFQSNPEFSHGSPPPRSLQLHGEGGVLEIARTRRDVVVSQWRREIEFEVDPVLLLRGAQASMLAAFFRPALDVLSHLLKVLSELTPEELEQARAEGLKAKEEEGPSK